MAILDLPKDIWFAGLGLTPDTLPDALILEGTWWRKTAEADRLGQLTDVREAALPDIFLGRHGDARIAYCCAYGAARAVEPAHVFAQMGVPLIVQIGTCGALAPGLGAGSVMVPDLALARDGVSGSYGGDAAVALDVRTNRAARKALDGMGIPHHNGTHLTWTSLFAQSDAICAEWGAEGIATVDMEAAAVATVARRFGSRATALLAVWDALAEGKTFLDPLPAADEAALRRANAATFTVALALAAGVAAERTMNIKTTTTLGGKTR